MIPMKPLPDILNSWWLKPAAAYRDGIVDETSHGITANENGAYAIVLTGSCEIDLGRDGEIRYKAAVSDPGVFRLTKTMLRADPEEKVVRVLRSWKLRSKIAPKAGLRYDGLHVSRPSKGSPTNTRDCHSYRVLSFSVHLSQPNTWQTAFTLSRLPTQLSLLHALHIPTSDQLDDWKDYQQLKLVDRGEDFEMLRDMLAQRGGAGEEVGDGGGLNDERHGSVDSGYFSRRSSKAISIGGGGRRDSILIEEMGETVKGGDNKEDDEGAEEADDEGVGLEDLEEVEEEEEEEENDRKGKVLNSNGDADRAKNEGTARPNATRTPTPEHLSHAFPQPRIGTRFISPRKPAD